MHPLTLLFLLVAIALPAAAQRPTVDNVFLVTLDGVRWQEVFGGADQALLGDRRATRDTAEYGRRFWRGSAGERREALMPFLWSVVARRGDIFGDSAAGAPARVTNGLWFSYPGYNELLAGNADPRVSSNDKVLNPNVTVLEWLNGRRRFRERVAAFGSWDVLPFILDTARSGLPANGTGMPFAAPASDGERQINDLARMSAPVFGSCCRLDAVTMLAATEYLRSKRPRVLYVMLGETDEWAHSGRYDLYLDAAQRADRFISDLWGLADSLPQYRGRTALVITTDHGRGNGARWTDHGREVPEAERIWIAILAPNRVGLGVRSDGPVTQSQVAATIAALLGEDYAGSMPGIAAALPVR